MGAFGLVFVFTMIAYWVGPNWRAALWISTGIGVVAYAVAFLLALSVDQPFGPVLVFVLAGVAVLAYLMQLGRRPVRSEAPER